MKFYNHKKKITGSTIEIPHNINKKKNPCQQNIFVLIEIDSLI